MHDMLIPVTEAKARLAEIVRECAHRDVLLLRHGRPAAVVLSADRYEALLDRLDDLEDRLAVHERTGVTVSLEALRAELDAADAAS